ncbi:MAG: xylanase [Clostridia bacterium]|nr:xylanase [Clostridia bacterium]
MREGGVPGAEYPNVFARIGVSDRQVKEKIRACFDTIFFDPEDGFYHDVDADSGCMEDTGNHDARTEGMSYGMMMCVQMDRQDLFDRLWQFSMRYMYLPEGVHQGYFAWSVGLDGRHNAEGPAPDGEEYYAMALLMADARWGSRDGIFDYAGQARAILRHCVHQHELVPGGGPMWNPQNHLIKFVPGMEISDPSYHLPHFYELFALHADEQDRAFWREAARASREYVAMSAHPVTGMSPEYAQYDGTPVLMFGKPYAYYSDAYRVAMNIALDTIWNGRNEALSAVVTRLQDFMAGELPMENLRAYDLDGTAHDEPAMHPTAIVAVMGAASAASDSARADMWLRLFWETPLRRGPRRYYDNCLYFFCLLMLGGQYRMFC